MNNTLISIFVLLALFGIKHFICDFWLQYSYMLKTKGIYGARGGLDHAGIHALGTFVLLMLVLPWNIRAHLAAVVLAILDGVVHYHIDWAKTNLSAGLTPTEKQFWFWFGLDQGLHYLTYVSIIAILFLL